MFATLIPEVERHEGVTGAPNSHYGVALQAYLGPKLQERFERLYTPKDDLALRQLASNTWMDFHKSSAYLSRQDSSDRTDYPKVAAALGCTLDDNASDR